MLVTGPQRQRSTAMQRRSRLSMFRTFVPPEYSTGRQRTTASNLSSNTMFTHSTHCSEAELWIAGG
jgi:hypothetical protein